MNWNRFLRPSTQGAMLALALALVLTSSGSLLSQAARSEAKSASAAIVFGVGSPLLTAERSGTSIGIVADGTLYIFDAGAGVERRIMEAGPKLAALKVQKLGPVFISHLHPDHTVGLAAMLFYHNMSPAGILGFRGPDLPVYGPGPRGGAPGIREVIDHLRAAFHSTAIAPGIRAEQLSGQGGPQLHAIDIAPGVVYRDSSLTVTAFEVAHKTPIAFGFRIQTADRVIVISGDTSPVDAVVDACNGCDLLFHEVFALDFGPSGPSGDGQGHTSAAELGELARRARPKRLVIYHDVRIPSPQAGLDTIRKAFSGEVTFAKDLDVF
jgi:ribonuclease BN (tRNA processing enzyme)